MKNRTTLAAFVAATVCSLITVSQAFAGAPVRVPEPGTMTLIGAGAAVVAVGAWWRNRK